MAIPGVGPLIAAGPIIATLAGAGVGGAMGGITGALVGMGIPEYEAERYEGRIQKGGILLSVHCATSDEVKRAKEIMERTGGEDISSTTEASATAERTMRRRAGGVEYLAKTRCGAKVGSASFLFLCLRRVRAVANERRIFRRISQQREGSVPENGMQ